MINNLFWKNKNVLITGHSGFKGNWLTRLLLACGANVVGYSKQPLIWQSDSEKNLYPGEFTEYVADINDTKNLTDLFVSEKISTVFHLAAQALVVDGYLDPLTTFQDNVVGTASVLDAVRRCPLTTSCIVVTSDKCYRNKEWLYAYRETDELGGHDPYSASKAAAELIVTCYQQSFFHEEKSTNIASVRAGNVIGGLDWSANRLIPDYFRALQSDKALHIRSPSSTRPWQFVLEPLVGYVLLGEKLELQGEDFSGPWNFGPSTSDSISVTSILDRLCRLTDKQPAMILDKSDLHEGARLEIDSSKARRLLNWLPKYDVDSALSKTSDWYMCYLANGDIEGLVYNQVKEFIDG